MEFRSPAPQKGLGKSFANQRYMISPAESRKRRPNHFIRWSLETGGGGSQQPALKLVLHGWKDEIHWGGKKEPGVLKYSLSVVLWAPWTHPALAYCSRLMWLQLAMNSGKRFYFVKMVVSPHVSVLVCRCDAKTRVGCGSLRGVPLLQASHPEGFDWAHFDDCAQKGEWEWNNRVNWFYSALLLVWRKNIFKTQTDKTNKSCFNFTFCQTFR